MTPEQALKLLDQAGAAALGNRADHVNIQQAIQVLAEFIRQKNAPMPPSNPSPDPPNDP